ncbi:hypothetical protein FXO38_19132 [Capsicum annuum]|nr:hypothetical protein FXO38_19132 [Capsicum annuum]KAF3677665.1 hypothetical protein FXO37_04724 [Capsicum annuum]
MDAQKQYYRIHGMPLDMQVWLYECCSVVHPKIIVEYASRIPRLLNWETTDKHAHFEVFIEAILADVDNPGHNVEVVEDIPVVSQSSSQHIGTDRSSTPKQGDTCSVKLNSPSYFIVDPDDDIQFNKVPKKKEILEENSHQIHTSDEQVIKDDGVATLGPEIESQYEIPDELLPSLNLMKSIIIHPTRCIKDDTTPVPMQRNRKLSRWNLSPFTTKFGSSSGTSASASCDSPILNKKHPFTPFIGCPYDLSIENKYLKWIKEGLLTTHERKMAPDFQFLHPIIEAGEILTCNFFNLFSRRAPDLQFLHPVL